MQFNMPPFFRRLGIAIGFVVAIWLCLPFPVAAHATPRQYYPAPNSVQATPPTNVHIRFSEHLNSDISAIVVTDPSNRRVDQRDEAVSADGFTLTVHLDALPAGTYVVTWKSHSADDGHVAGGSYLFSIARPDGSVPAYTGPLPSGTIVGGGAGSTGLDSLAVFSTLSRLLSLLALTAVLGIIWWWVAVIPRQPRGAMEQQSRLLEELRGTLDIALQVVLAGTIVEIGGQVLLVGGGIQSFFALPLLGRILLNSRLGNFLLARGLLAIAGLVCINIPRLRTILHAGELRVIASAYGIGMAVIFEYSGHGGVGFTWWSPVIDAFHLLANGIWLGGLFVLALIVLPLWQSEGRQAMRTFVLDYLPAFSLPALIAVAFLSVTGPLNAAPRMQWNQLWTTAYGIVLLVKIAIFMGMIGLSAWHAFILRPNLQQPDQSRIDQPSIFPSLQLFFSAIREASFPAHKPSTATLALESTTSGPDDSRPNLIFNLIRIEAMLGVVLLGCATFLGPLAGTLAQGTSPTFGARGGVQHQTRQIDGLTVELTVDPGRFGTNGFSVTVHNSDGSVASNSTIFLLTSMIEMDMGTNQVDLTPASTAGTYTGRGDLTMPGHWQITAVIRTEEDPNHLHRTTFTIGVGS